MNTTKDKPFEETVSDLEMLRADVAALKRDLAATLTHLKGGAVHSARNAGEHLTDAANELAENLSAQSERAIKALGEHVEQQPVASVLVAFSVGFVLSRILR